MSENAKVFGRVGLEFTAEVQGQTNPLKAMSVIRQAASTDAPGFMAAVVSRDPAPYRTGAGDVIEVTHLDSASCELWAEEDPALSEEQCADQTGRYAYVPDADASRRIVGEMARAYHDMSQHVLGGLVVLDRTITNGESPILEKQVLNFLDMQRLALDQVSPETKHGVEEA